MKKIITTLALVCVLSTPLTPQANAQELSPEREQEMRAEITRLQVIANDLIALYFKKFGSYPEGTNINPFSSLASFVKSSLGIDVGTSDTSAITDRYSRFFQDENDESTTDAGTTSEVTTIEPANPQLALRDHLKTFDFGSIVSIEGLFGDDEDTDEDVEEEEEEIELPTTLEGAFDIVESYAEALHNKNGTYGTVCNKVEVVSIRLEYDAVCIDSTSQYLIYAEYDDNYYCADTTGFAGETDEVNERAMECGEPL